MFAAQCISWLESIIEFTEILNYYRHYKVFALEYVKDLVVSSLLNPAIAGSHNPESEIPVLDINNSDTEVHSGPINLLPNYWSKKQLQLHRTRSGKIFKN